jgi:hypothetical protein
MQQLLSLTGSIAGVIGILLCAVSGLGRAMGLFWVAGYEASSLFSLGTGVMVFACLVQLHLLLVVARS